MTTKKKMTAEEEHKSYAEPQNQIPAGPAVRRRAKLSEPVPVRFSETLLAEIRDQAAADDLERTFVFSQRLKVVKVGRRDLVTQLHLVWDGPVPNRNAT